MVRVVSLNLKDFRGFSSIELALDRPLTVIVGVNGAGKSSLLDALAIALGRVVEQAKGRPVKTDAMLSAAIRRGRDGVALRVEVRYQGKLCAVEATAAAQGNGHDASAGNFLNWMGPPSGLPIAAEYLTMYFPANRAASPDLRTRWKETGPADQGLGAMPEKTVPADAFEGALGEGALGFHDLFRWFREREDYENAEKVQRASLAWSDPQLDAVRAAVTSLLPGFTRLRVDRTVLRMTVDKAGEPFALDQLSDGERTLLAMVADIARRLAIANPGVDDVLGCETVVLIDEIELHLHPSWQRTVLAALRRTFPRCQFVVTTHSPQVLSEVANDAVVLLKDFACFDPPAPTEGRDSNAILWEVLGVPARPAAVVAELDAVRDLLDADRVEEARVLLDRLAEKLTERDPEVLRLRTDLDVITALESSPQESDP